MSNECNGLILVTVGLPGAGKTTICHSLLKTLSMENSLICRLVSYDDHLNDRCDWGQADLCWKSERKALLDEIASWLSDSIQRTASNDTPSSSKHSKVWLIVDDNMYYRGMRYPYYQLAQKYRMTYAQLYVICPIETAKRRNSNRVSSQRIPDEVIERMHCRLEEPKMCTWEKNTYSVHSDDDVVKLIVLESILDFLREASQNPAPPPAEGIQPEKERQREITKKSLLHQADLVLRNIINEYYKSGERRHTTGVLIEVKRRLLEDIRNGRLNVNAVSLQDLDLVRTVFFNLADALSEQ